MKETAGKNSTYAIFPGKIFSGTGSGPETNKAIVVEGDKIKEVADSDSLNLSQNVKIIEAEGKTLLPGLIDAHVHTYNNGEEKAKEYPASALTGYLALRSFINAREDLMCGFTTVRDCSSRRYVDVALKQLIEEGELIGPRMIVSGHGLSMTGGHGDVKDFPSAELFEDLAVCDTPGEARKQARKQMKMGADFIKVHATGGSFGNGSKPGAQQLSEEEIRAAVVEAHKAGKKVAAHAMGTDGMRAAVRAGVDSIEHGFWMTEDIAELMAEKGTTFVPTLTPLYRNETRGGHFDTEEEQRKFKDKAKEIRKSHLESFALAREKGVTIACGSDSGGGPLLRHGENGIELELMVEAGMTPSEVLISATRTNSELLGLDDRLGTLEEGKIADMVLVDGNPMGDMTVFQENDRLQVFKSGRELTTSSSC